MHTDTQRRLAVLAAITIVTVATAPAGVAAQTDESGPFDALGDGDRDLSAAVAGAYERLEYWVASRTPGIDAPGGGTAEQNADAIQSAINDDSGAIAAYANDEINDSNVSLDEYDVVAIVVTGEDGATATRYLEVTHANGTIDSMQVVESTNEAVDWRIELSEYASAEADDDIERFVANYVQPDRSLDDGSIESRLAGKYGAGPLLSDGAHINATEVT